MVSLLIVAEHAGGTDGDLNPLPLSLIVKHTNHYTTKHISSLVSKLICWTPTHTILMIHFTFNIIIISIVIINISTIINNNIIIVIIIIIIFSIIAQILDINLLNKLFY